jgi:hypothetical protein
MSLPFIYGYKPQRKLPRVTADTVLLHADRFNRAAERHQDWATIAKRAVEYFESKQWSDEDLAFMNEQKRAALTINKIKPLVNLVLGYHLSNKTDITYTPGHDGTGNGDIAKALSFVSKQISQINLLPYIDAEVFFDGLVGGRGYYDQRLDFESNDFGDVRYRVQDPFATYLDPDADTYDLDQSSNFIMTSRFVSVDEVEHVYGKEASMLVSPLVSHMAYNSMPVTLFDGWEEITPWRRFGGEREGELVGPFAGTFYDWVDTARKSVRLLDIQHYVWVERWYFIDLETGDRSPIPDHWTKEKVDKVLFWAAQQNNPLVVTLRPERRVRWTHMIGDVVVYDDWSPYRRFTIKPFFPYFRRGKTKGMVEDLMDPQDEVNKRRSARLNIIARSSNGGWMYAKGSLDAMQKANLELYGSTPGFHLEYETRNGTLPEPKQIQPPTVPVAQNQLEIDAEDDLNEISGVNKDALGMVEKVQSGIAIQAKQRQTVVGLEGFMSNWTRTKILCGRGQLELIQNHYVEQRIVRTMGTGNTPEQIIINERAGSGIINNVSLGKYDVVVNEVPISATFLAGQFEDLLRLKEIGIPIPDEFLIEASSAAKKEDLLAALQAQRQAQAVAATLQGQPGAGQPAVGSEGDFVSSQEPGAPLPVAAE